MEILIAISHILGSFIAIVIFGLVLIKVARWEVKWNLNEFKKEAALALGVPVEDINNEELVHDVIRFSAQKFSPELIQNRISDVCGAICRIWGWLSNTILLLIFVVVIWQTITDSTEFAVYAWYALGSTLAFSLVHFIFSLACKLITGRNPGQAKEARAFASEWVNNNIDDVLYNKN